MEFLRYPQVIPALFSGRLVRSSMKLYLHFNLPMDRSPGFGSTSCNFVALFRLALASAPNLKFLTSLHNVTRRSVLQKVRYRTFNVLYLLVNTGFQVLFHSPPVVLPASHRIPRVPRYSGAICPCLTSLTGLLPSPDPLSFGIQLVFHFSLMVLNPQCP